MYEDGRSEGAATHVVLEEVRPDGMNDQVDNVIELHRVSKTFSGAHAVRNVSLHIPRACVYVVRGDQGAGKTTLLRMMVGLERPDVGSIWVDGFNAWEDRAVLRHRIGYMPQRFGLYPFFTTEEYLDFFIACYGIAAHDRHRLSEELLELAELIDRRTVMVDSLSVDQKQALALARCLIHDPDVLVLDDPFAHIAQSDQEALSDMVRELANLGKTVVLSTRDPLIPLEPYSCVDVLVDGEVIRDRSSHAVIER